MKEEKSDHNLTISLLLQNQPVKYKEYLSFLKECYRVVRSLMKRYDFGKVVYSKSLLEDISDEITVTALTKALKQYKRDKNTKFMTYFYYKARSEVQVQQGKYYRRFKLINNIELNEHIKIKSC